MSNDTAEKGVSQETATSEEIQEYEDEHGEPHPVFDVPHRPERKPVNARNEDRFVFYLYDDDEDDPRFSFWLETEEYGGMSLFERPPDGQGVWLKPEFGSEYDCLPPSDELKMIISEMMDGEVCAERVHDLPPHERYFVQVIHGTIDEDLDAIPGPVWAWMHDAADEVTA